MDKIYFIISTINGEIDGEPYISLSLDYQFPFETIIYQINLSTLEVIEIKSF